MEELYLKSNVGKACLALLQLLALQSDKIAENQWFDFVKGDDVQARTLSWLNHYRKQLSHEDEAFTIKQLWGAQPLSGGVVNATLTFQRGARLAEVFGVLAKEKSFGDGINALKRVESKYKQSMKSTNANFASAIQAVNKALDDVKKGVLQSARALFGSAPPPDPAKEALLAFILEPANKELLKPVKERFSK